MVKLDQWEQQSDFRRKRLAQGNHRPYFWCTEDAQVRGIIDKKVSLSINYFDYNLRLFLLGEADV